MAVEAVFAVLAAITLGGALLAVTVRGLFRAALGLMVSLIGMAGLFMLQQAEFLAVVQVLVYVGGVSVLIVFAIMLTDRGEVSLDAGLNRAMVPWALIAGIGLAAVAITTLRGSGLADSPAAEADAGAIGAALLNRFLVPFEAVSLLLLVALIGALLIARSWETSS